VEYAIAGRGRPGVAADNGRKFDPWRRTERLPAMAVQPGKRSPRKPSPVLADPETVAKVSRATAKGVHAVVTAIGAVAGFMARNSVALAKWAAPRISTLVVAVAIATWRGIAAIGRWTWSHKRGVAGVGHRLLWWGALAILVLVGRALLSADGDPELVGAALLWFGVGLSMSVLVLLGAPEKRMRLAAVALAGGHGSLAALAWVACSGV
jgi:hypothetical protein